VSEVNFEICCAATKITPARRYCQAVRGCTTRLPWLVGGARALLDSAGAAYACLTSGAVLGSICGGRLCSSPVLSGKDLPVVVGCPGHVVTEEFKEPCCVVQLCALGGVDAEDVDTFSYGLGPEPN
jgi:hypothetical protein